MFIVTLSNGLKKYSKIINILYYKLIMIKFNRKFHVLFMIRELCKYIILAIEFWVGFKDNTSWCWITVSVQSGRWIMFQHFWLVRKIISNTCSELMSSSPHGSWSILAPNEFVTVLILLLFSYRQGHWLNHYNFRKCSIIIERQKYNWNWITQKIESIPVDLHNKWCVA